MKKNMRLEVSVNMFNVIIIKTNKQTKNPAGSLKPLPGTIKYPCSLDSKISFFIKHSQKQDKRETFTTHYIFVGFTNWLSNVLNGNPVRVKLLTINSLCRQDLASPKKWLSH